MKNLIHLIDKLDELPIDTLWYRPQGEHMREMPPYNSWERGRYWHGYADGKGRYKHMSSWRYIRVYLRSRIGKSFDNSFAVFCKRLPITWQKDFLDEFQESKNNWRRKHYGFYFVDEKGLIQYKPALHEKRIYTFYSADHKIGYRDKRTKNPVATDRWGSPYRNSDNCEPYTVQGFSRTFESLHDKELIRLKEERKKHRRKIKKAEKKAARAKGDGMLKVAQLQRDLREAKALEQEGLRTEEIKRKQDQLNKLTIERLGFDPVTSFRNSYGSYRKDNRTNEQNT